MLAAPEPSTTLAPDLSRAISIVAESIFQSLASLSKPLTAPHMPPPLPAPLLLIGASSNANADAASPLRAAATAAASESMLVARPQKSRPRRFWRADRHRQLLSAATAARNGSVITSASGTRFPSVALSMRE